ncbi:hypothetical protein LOZ66_006785 [Ophidiomyces ophidiicola]|nr:hypothetical protein LOZ66_006785 [Ophidiomyces ophidiicola]
MDFSIGVYYSRHKVEVCDYTAHPPLPQTVRNDAVHIFDSQNGWFIASRQKPAVHEVLDLLSEFSCEEECFLDAAAVCHTIAPEAALGYDRIINMRGLDRRFRSRCEARDVLISNHLKYQRKEWLGFGRKLKQTNGEESTDDWIRYLYSMKDHIEAEIKHHPRNWRQALQNPLAIADCIGRIQSISRQSRGAGELEAAIWRFPATKLKCVRDRYTLELKKIDGTIADLTSRWTTVVGVSLSMVYFFPNFVNQLKPTLSRFLLHLVVLLMASEYEVVRPMANYENAISWTEAEWQHQIHQSRCLSEDDYLGLTEVLTEYRMFSDGIKLGEDELKGQHMALMAGLKAMVPEFPWEYAGPPDPSFSASMNIMILCACLRIFPVCPADRIEERVDIDYVASQLSRSPLHKMISLSEVRGQHDRLIDFLMAQKSLTAERSLAVPDDSEETMRSPLSKRPSQDEIREDGKRPKVDGTESN